MLGTFQNCNVQERFLKDSSLILSLKIEMMIFRSVQGKRGGTREHHVFRKGFKRWQKNETILQNRLGLNWSNVPVNPESFVCLNMLAAGDIFARRTAWMTSRKMISASLSDGVSRSAEPAPRA
jgi:hypothetical protein